MTIQRSSVRSTIATFVSPAIMFALVAAASMPANAASQTAPATAAAKPELVTKAVPLLTSFVTRSGGANVGNLLASALK